MNHGPPYLRVFFTFVRNSLVRDMTFRSNFLIECVSSVSWIAMNLGFYLLIFSFTDEMVPDSGWRKYEFFVFLATTMFINSIVQTFFMPNAQELSEQIRTGALDFALLKPIDTQFLVSLQRMNWSSLANFAVAVALMVVSVGRLVAEKGMAVTPTMVVMYLFYLGCGVLILYSLMVSLAATSIWLGRNQSLYNFWFYITNFSRYPMEIYDGKEGTARQKYGAPLQLFFTYIIPVLMVVNVPARTMARPIITESPFDWFAAVVVATVGSLVASRLVFQRALGSYRSASS